MKFKRSVTIVGILLLISSLFPAIVGAEVRADEDQVGKDLAIAVLNASDPDEAYLALTEAQQGLVDDAILSNLVTEIDVEASKIGTPDADNALLSDCWSRTKTVHVTSLGVHVYTFSQILEWCGDYVMITSHNDWIEASTGLFWRYNGVIDYWTLGGVGFTAYRVHAQGEFEYCPGGNCGWQYQYPIVDQQGSMDGSYWQN